MGIATNIPPHNLREVVSGLCALIHNPEITVKQLMQHIPAPDFPTGAVRAHLAAAQLAYGCHGSSTVPNMPQAARSSRQKLSALLITTARSITVRGRVHVEDDGASSSRGGKAARKPGSVARAQLVITELPYQSNKVST